MTTQVIDEHANMNPRSRFCHQPDAVVEKDVIPQTTCTLSMVYLPMNAVAEPCSERELVIVFHRGKVNVNVEKGKAQNHPN